MGITIRPAEGPDTVKPYKPWGGVPFVNPNMVRPSVGQTRYYNMAAVTNGGNVIDAEFFVAGDKIVQDFPNTCGPFPQLGGCGEAITPFTGTITGNTSDIVDEGGGLLGVEYEVKWDRKPGDTSMTTYDVFTYENPSNFRRVPSELPPPLTTTPTSQADCREGETFVEAVYPPCVVDEECFPVTPAYCQGPTGDITPTTAGTTSKSILPILIIGGLIYYLYTKDK